MNDAACDIILPGTTFCCKRGGLLSAYSAFKMAVLKAEGLGSQQKDHRNIIINVMHKNNMKQVIFLFMIVAVLLGIRLSTFAEDKGRIQKEKIITQKFNEQTSNSIGQYRFPLTVNSFVKDLGRPDSTVTDQNESCPVGQIHTWCLRTENLKILVLGDHYKPNVDFSAESRLFALAKCGHGKDSGFTGLWGIKFGDSDREVNQKLIQIQKQNRQVSLKRNINGAPIHVLFNGWPISHHHSMKKDGLFFYFVMNKRGRLEVIIQSSFDLSTLC